MVVVSLRLKRFRLKGNQVKILNDLVTVKKELTSKKKEISGHCTVDTAIIGIKSMGRPDRSCDL